MFDKDLMLQAMRKLGEVVSLVETAIEAAPAASGDTQAKTAAKSADPTKSASAATATKKAGRPKKEAAPAPVQSAAEVVEDFEDDNTTPDSDTDDLDSIEDQDDEEDGEEQHTQETVRDALMAYAGKHGKAKAYAIMDKFGSRKVADIKPSQYAKLAAALK